jgi:hypothetical protein
MFTSNLAIYAVTLTLLWVVFGIRRHERRDRRAQDLHLWLHHDRPAPEGWMRIDSAEQMIDMLNVCGPRITAVSLGAGAESRNGYSVVRHLAAMAADGRYVPVVEIEAADAVERMLVQAEVGMIRRNQSQRMHALTPRPLAAA